MQADIVRPKRTRLKRRFIFFILFLILGVSGVFLFLNSSFFSVTKIVVDGNANISNDEVLKIIGVHLGTNLFRINQNQINEATKRYPQIEQITVKKSYPHVLYLHVKERYTFALVLDKKGMIYAIDKNGCVLSKRRDMGDANLPIITGIDSKEYVIGERIKTKGFSEAKQCLYAFDPVLRQEISEISVEGNEDIVLYTVEGIKVLWGENNRAGQKAEIFRALLPNIIGKADKILYVDLRYYGNPVVKLKVGDKNEVQ